MHNKIKFVVPSFKEITHHFKPALTFFLAKISTTLFNNLNKTMLGLFSTMSVVGIYSNSLILVLMSGGILNSLNTVMLPYMSKIYKQRRKDFFRRLITFVNFPNIFVNRYVFRYCYS